MDAPDDRDVKLQRASADLLAEFESFLPRFLWTSVVDDKAVPSPRVVRKLVNEGRTKRLITLLEPFQEWPQLLDPKLSSFLHPLVSAFLAYLCMPGNSYRHDRHKFSPWVIPLPRAICKIVYTLSKVRGEKVISQFLNNEPKYLEPMLDAYYDWNRPEDDQPEDSGPGHGPLIWEERYVMLLWLSHLMLTPFDLSSISSIKTDTKPNLLFPQIILPPDTPDIARRIVSICIRYLGSASKEREAARSLLVRLALRPDMLKLGLLASLIQWTISSLENGPKNDSSKSIYSHIGVLSFLAGAVVSAEKFTIAPFLMQIFKCIQHINIEQSTLSREITSSALARKTIIKILRAITVQTLQPDSAVTLPHLFLPVEDVLEEVIEHLLSSLADIDTPVRYAASKALSVIAVKLQPTMAAEIVEAVVESLEENVLWEKVTNGETSAILDSHSPDLGLFRRNLTAVNALKWQGLVLTLSHLLYRRSPPPQQLPSILNALILALSFEQRSSVGSSVGTSVRDAACFGIWALARRYTTDELLAIDTLTIRAANSQDHPISVLQVLATDVVVTAALDSSGNIRRGASAALQEMIGRHPDTVINGIPLVQIVDYHAVALRSRAIKEVAIGAAALDEVYWSSMLDGLLDWRGVGSPDAPSRRLAASAIGRLAVSSRSGGIEMTVARLRDNLKRVEPRQVEEQHGLILALAAILRESWQKASNLDQVQQVPIQKLAGLWDIVHRDALLPRGGNASSAFRPELMAEAASIFISALASGPKTPFPNSATINDTYPSSVDTERCIKILNSSLLRMEDIVISAAAKAAGDLFNILTASDQKDLTISWAAALRQDSSNRSRGTMKIFGIMAALGSVFRYFKSEDLGTVSPTQQIILDSLLLQIGPEVEVESRVAAVQSIATGVLTCGVMDKDLAGALNSCLDDYTTDQRGDVGSLVRVEAIDAVAIALKYDLFVDIKTKHRLIARICSLATEKLDKVRFRAWTCIQGNWGIFQSAGAPLNSFPEVADTSTKAYFTQLIDLCSLDWVRIPLLQGYVTSAGAGSEALLRSSREALIDHAEQLPSNELIELCRCLISIIRENVTNDRLVIPTLDVLGFLFDAGVLQRLDTEDFSWRNTFALIERTHYKSGNVRKLEAAVRIYSGLATVGTAKGEALSKLCSLLLHPFPKIRNTTADALLLVTSQEAGHLKRIDWSEPAKGLRKDVQELRIQLQVAN